MNDRRLTVSRELAFCPYSTFLRQTFKGVKPVKPSVRPQKVAPPPPHAAAARNPKLRVKNVLMVPHVMGSGGPTALPIMAWSLWLDGRAFRPPAGADVVQAGL